MSNYTSYTTQFPVSLFQRDLLSWYKQNARKLPWRENKDPYRIWVSEIMLQQTRVDTVIPYFERFIEQFPTIQALAEAEEERVLKAWEGLGYYSRVRNLQTAVREVHENYGGIVPKTSKEISSLKGVGPYTAGAVLSIAYGVPEPAVDGNVMRVLSRILLIEEDISKAKTRITFEKAVRDLIDPTEASFFNQALMELGALVCTPKSPACLICPVQDHCRAFVDGRQSDLPVKTGKVKTRIARMAAVIAVNDEGKMLIHKRPNQGLLANLWEFPNEEVVELPKVSKKIQFIEKLNEHGIDIDLDGELAQIDHVFSHLKWEITVYEGKILQLPDPLNSDWKLVDLAEVQQYPFPVSHQKIIRLAEEVVFA